MFVANRGKSPQNRHKIAKIVTYAGFADPDFRLRQRALKKFPNGPLVKVLYFSFIPYFFYFHFL